MINVALLGVIRCWHHRDGIGTREIARHTGVSQNTASQNLASQILAPCYTKYIAPPNWTIIRRCYPASYRDGSNPIFTNTSKKPHNEKKGVFLSNTRNCSPVLKRGAVEHVRQLGVSCSQAFR